MARQSEESGRLISLATSLLVTTRDTETTVTEIASRGGIKIAAAKKIVELAQAAINEAADTDVREEIGTAKMRLNKIYEIALKSGEAGTALDAVKEINKLLKLNARIDYNLARQTIESDRDKLIRKHLAVYDDMPSGLPLEELARRIALRVIATRGDTSGGLQQTQTRRGRKVQTNQSGVPRRRATAGNSKSSTEAKKQGLP